MSKLITSKVTCEDRSPSVREILKAFEIRGWLAYRDTMPFLYSVSDTDLMDERQASSDSDVDAALANIQQRIDKRQQFSLNLSCELRGTIGIFGEYKDSRWVFSCHFSCFGLELDDRLMDLNAAADIFVRTMLDGGFEISEYRVEVTA